MRNKPTTSYTELECIKAFMFPDVFRIEYCQDEEVAKLYHINRRRKRKFVHRKIKKYLKKPIDKSLKVWYN